MEEELAYLGEETRFVPKGGETCAVNPPRSDCATALTELELLHFSYLNLSYHGEVLDRWRDQGCFDEMRDRLGYRLAVVEVARSECVRPGGDSPCVCRSKTVATRRHSTRGRFDWCFATPPRLSLRNSTASTSDDSARAPTRWKRRCVSPQTSRTEIKTWPCGSPMPMRV